VQQSRPTSETRGRGRGGPAIDGSRRAGAVEPSRQIGERIEQDVGLAVGEILRTVTASADEDTRHAEVLGWQDVGGEAIADDSHAFRWEAELGEAGLEEVG
jgi:hypothetical protein